MPPVPRRHELNTTTPLSPFQAHVWHWQFGCGSNQCHGARKVFARGDLPCDILFLGEAPGEGENAIGLPFVGPAGQLLDRIIANALKPFDNPPTICMCNLVCCIPRDDNGRKSGEPDDDQVKACAPRLMEFVELADPKLLVCVGTLARDFTDLTYRHRVAIRKDLPRICIHHPAYLIRMNVSMRGLEIQRCVVQVRQAVEDLMAQEGRLT